LLMLQRKGSRICSFNHGWALKGEHGGTDSTLGNNLKRPKYPRLDSLYIGVSLFNTAAVLSSDYFCFSFGNYLNKSIRV
jgi:hypothetical protein